jgi:hypothetical protein
MNPMTQAVLKAGLITPNMLQEMKRFSPTLDQNAVVEEPKDLERAAQLIADALEHSDLTLVRETDLNALRHYVDTRTDGTLHYETLAETVDFTVSYAVAKTGEYLIAWNSEGLLEEIANGMTYLKTDTKEVYFKDVRELWYGERKTFLVCVPREDHVDAG